MQTCLAPVPSCPTHHATPPGCAGGGATPDCTLRQAALSCHHHNTTTSRTADTSNAGVRGDGGVTWGLMLSSRRVKAVHGRPARFHARRIELADGSFIEADVVLYCTGYRNTYELLEPGVRERLLQGGRPGGADGDADGPYLYRSMLPPDVPNLAIVGAEVRRGGGGCRELGALPSSISRALTGSALAVLLDTLLALARFIALQGAWGRPAACAPASASVLHSRPAGRPAATPSPPLPPHTRARTCARTQAS